MKSISLRCLLQRAIYSGPAQQQVSVSRLSFIPCLPLVTLSINQTIFRQRESFAFVFQRKSLVSNAGNNWHVRRYTCGNSITQF